VFYRNTGSGIIANTRSIEKNEFSREKMRMFETIRYEKHGAIAVVTLNRPEAGNSHTAKMGQELTSAWNDANEDSTIRVVILTGAGDKFFCAGADAKAMSRGESIGPFGDIPENFRKPVMLAINGICAGGGFHFVWQSDFAICAEHATFMEPHVSIGWVPLREMMGLAERAPLGVVFRMAFMGTKERMSAQRAYDLGIVTEVVAAERLMERAMEIAGCIAEQAPLAIEATKEILHRAFELRFAHRKELDHGILLREARTHHSEDYREGPRAFAERRKPQWKGK
jgi:enoyl-CoA hydratase/carnithine racemase